MIITRLLAFSAVMTVALATTAQTPRPDLEQLERRAAGLIPTRKQLRYQEIPWVHDLAEAMRTAREEDRPVFLWGYGGRARPDNGLEGC
ncbi:MAG: hypothetical protein K1X57_21795 [Gemmataceae bacterium]|nr:hypothetical protein [Gemmataceae bacterium]